MSRFIEQFFYALTLIMILIIGGGFVATLTYWVLDSWL